MSTGVTAQPDSNRLIACNGQFFALADQSHRGLKVFLASVPTYNGTTPKAVHTWYMLFTKMAATTEFYIHPYFCFQRHANHNYGFTCGFDTAPVAGAPEVLEILYQPEVPAVAARLHIPANPAPGQLEVLVLAGSSLVSKVLG